MFKWVHLSDIHFQENEGYNIEIARTELQTYLNQEIGKCDAVFFTGDFRFAKKSKGNVEKIYEYIVKIKEAVNAEYVFCVPGNHDLERSPMREAIIDGVYKKYNAPTEEVRDSAEGTFDSSMLEYLISGFEFYNQIQSKFGNQLIDKDNIHNLIELPDCNLLLLNTAITAGRDEERGSLLLGKRYVKTALEKANSKKPIIAIGHHGMSFWDRDEQKALFDLFERKKVKLYLCGHEHALFDEWVGKEILQMTTGCLKNEKSPNVDIGFSTGTLLDDSEASLEIHQWINGTNTWVRSKKIEPPIVLLKKSSKKKEEKSQPKIRANYSLYEAKKYPFMLNGHSLIGPRGKDGIKYYWQKGEDRVESLAFNKRLCEPSKDEKKAAEDNSISAYTISTSFGCILAASMLQCRFCETGSRQFKGLLSAEEIAIQSIFMANYDANCQSYPELRNHKREISFMGQGEPGYNYTAIRRAIQINDIAMDAIKQEIYRYNISTSGISTFMPSFIDDLENKIFANKVSLHFSLHAIDDDRTRIMPINTQFDYLEFLSWCKRYFEITGEKIGVGLLMFEKFKPVLRMGEANFEPYTLSQERLKRILEKLDPKIHKIDLCDLNKASVIDRWKTQKNEDAEKLLNLSESLGFETKIFSSFGSNQHSGCGMLRSEYVDVDEDGEKTKELYEDSLRLLNYAISELGGK